VRDVIEAPREELITTLGIEPEKIDEIVTMLKKGLEEAEIEEEGEEKPRQEQKASVPPKVVPDAEVVAEKSENEEPESHDTKKAEE